jgi:choice-of-anchor A domain-containing protein
LEDYNFQGGDVQGQVLIGGDLNASGHAVEFGSRLANTNTAIDAVTIMGDVNANQIRVLNDNNLVYGGALNVSHVELNDGNDGKAIANADLSIDDVAASLHADSAYFASLSANGTYSDGIFNYIGTDSVAVFNVSADDVFAQNSDLSLNWGDAETVIINVSASNALANDIVVGGGVNLNNGFNGSEAFSNVLWNFYDAESIDFNSLAVKGSVLAPLATTSGGASFDGSFAAVSYTGAREFHNYVFNYEAPSAPPVVSVPEPPTIAVLAVLLLFLSFRRARRY